MTSFGRIYILLAFAVFSYLLKLNIFCRLIIVLLVCLLKSQAPFWLSVSRTLFVYICNLYLSAFHIYIYLYFTNWFSWFKERWTRTELLLPVVVCISRALKETESVFNGCACEYIEPLSTINFGHHLQTYPDIVPRWHTVHAKPIHCSAVRFVRWLVHRIGKWFFAPMPQSDLQIDSILKFKCSEAV